MYREGLHIFITAGLLLIGCLIGWFVSAWFPCIVGAWLSGLVFLFTLFAFRNPRRHPPQKKTILLAPSDGRVVDIVQLDHCAYSNGPARRVSIYLSPLDVHINRSPVTGRIFMKEYRKGRFYPAFRTKSSDLNEHTVVGIEGIFGRIYFKQIAGMLFRRIVCHLNENDRVRAGEPFGMIKFGSRVELFLPPEIQILTSIGDRVTAGVSIIGEFHESQ